MKFLLLSLLALSAFATNVELNQKKIDLGNLGAGDVVYQNGYFNLERTSETPKVVTLKYELKVTEMQCTRYETRYYSCGGVVVRRGGYYPAPYPGRPYPGRPYPGNGYPGYRYPAPGYPGYGMCADSVCVERQPVLVDREFKLKLNFRKAEKLMSGEVENYELQFSAAGSRANINVTAPAGYQVKQLNKQIKFKKSIK